MQSDGFVLCLGSTLCSKLGLRVIDSEQLLMHVHKTKSNHRYSTISGHTQCYIQFKLQTPGETERISSHVIYKKLL